MIKLTYRQAQFLLASISFAVLLCSLYFQYVQGLQPCPLCLVQRFCVLLIALLCLSAVAMREAKQRKRFTYGVMLIALLGLLFAGRQLWIESLPMGEAPACLPDFSMLMHYFPWSDVVHAFLWGSGDCAKVSWTWLGLSMAAWSALYFLLISAASSLVLWNL